MVKKTMAETNKIKAIAFLGNPGAEYAETRHNAGRMLAALFNAEYQNKFKGLFSNVNIVAPSGESEWVYFLLPETYMNLSGESVGALLSFYKIAPRNLLVVHDEIELPPGRIALKWSGGLGGHNGLRSIKACLGTADFWRLRIGVGRPAEGADIAAWVLSPFGKAERETLAAVLDKCKSIVEGAVLGEPVAQTADLS